MAVDTIQKELLPLIPSRFSTSRAKMPTDTPKNEGISVVWKNLCVTALIKNERLIRPTTYTEKEIIHNVNGRAPPSSLIAIMGASGSGKSTLMSVLANRQTGDLRISGDIRIDGKKIQMKYLRRVSGYVYQEDLFMPALTVLEHMHLAAKLKLDHRISESHRAQIVNELLTDVGLLNCTLNRIGSTSFGKGKVNLSGGERKRLSVATELLTNPSLLFCDEPTTGLDSFSAFKLINIMKNLAEQKNRTIICSIHQPSEQLFSLFHQVILLYKGRIAFSGTPNDALEFFSSLGYKFTSGQNSAEFLVRNLAVIPGNEAESAEKAAGICKQFQISHYADDIYRYIENETTSQETRGVPMRAKIRRRVWPFHLILYRNMLSILRDPTVQGLTLVNKMILGLLIGICLLGSATMTQGGIQSLKGAVFTMVAENVFSPIYSSLDNMPKQMPIFQREYSNNMNSPSMFYLANVISLTPGMIIDSSVFCTFLYWLTGLKADLPTFGWTVFINVLVLNTSCAFGTLVSIVTPSIDLAHLILSPITSLFLILSGIFVSLRTVPIYFRWLRYVSWVTLSNEALMILQMNGVDDIACSSNPDQPCLKTGAEVLSQLDYSVDNFWRNIIIIIIIYLVLHAVAFCVFSVKIYRRTKRKSLKSKRM